MSIRKRLQSGVIAMMLLRVYSMILMLLLNGCLTRWMAPKDVANFLTGTNLLILIGMVGRAGLDQSMVRLVAGRQEHDVSERRLLIRCWRSALVFGAGTLVVFALIIHYQLAQSLSIEPKLILVILCCSVLLSFHKLISSSLRSLHAIAASSFLEGRSGGPLANSVFFLVVAIFAMNGLSASEAFWSLALAMLLTAPIGVALLRQELRKTDNAIVANESLNGTEIRTVLVFSAPFLLTQLLTYFATEFDILLAKAFTGDDATALFGSARRLILQALAPMQILTATVGSTIAQLHAGGRRRDLQRLLRYSSTVCSVATIPLLLICIAFPEVVLSSVFGAHYAGAATVFVIMAVGQIVNCLTGQCAALMMMAGRTTVVLIVKSIAVVVMIGLGSMMARVYGITGLAMSTAITVSLQNLVLWLLARRLLGFWTHPLVRPSEVFAAVRSFRK